MLYCHLVFQNGDIESGYIHSFRYSPAELSINAPGGWSRFEFTELLSVIIFDGYPRDIDKTSRIFDWDGIKPTFIREFR